MTTGRPTQLAESPHRYVSTILERHPHKDFILARAHELAKENGVSFEENVDRALAEFEDTNVSKKSWAGALYAFGGSVLGVGLCLWIQFYMTTPVALAHQIALIFLMILGLLFILAGRAAE